MNQSYEKGALLVANETVSIDKARFNHGSVTFPILFEFDPYEDDWFSEGSTFIFLHSIVAPGFDHPFLLVVTPDGLVAVVEDSNLLVPLVNAEPPT